MHTVRHVMSIISLTKLLHANSQYIHGYSVNYNNSQLMWDSTA